MSLQDMTRVMAGALVTFKSKGASEQRAELNALKEALEVHEKYGYSQPPKRLEITAALSFRALHLYANCEKSAVDVMKKDGGRGVATCIGQSLKMYHAILSQAVTAQTAPNGKRERQQPAAADAAADQAPEHAEEPAHA